jgi:hypothetical protein
MVELVLLKSNTEIIHFDGFCIMRDKKGFYDATTLCKKMHKTKRMWGFLLLPTVIKRLETIGGREQNMYKAVLDGVKLDMISPTLFLPLIRWLDPKLDAVVTEWLIKNASMPNPKVKEIENDLHYSRLEITKLKHKLRESDNVYIQRISDIESELIKLKSDNLILLDAIREGTILHQQVLNENQELKVCIQTRDDKLIHAAILEDDDDQRVYKKIKI